MDAENMVRLHVIYSAVMLLCSTRLSVALQLNPECQDSPITEYSLPTSKTSVAAAVPHIAPCFVDDMFAVLREGVGDGDELTNSTLALFGICTVSDHSSRLLDLANKKDSLGFLYSAEAHVSEEEVQETLTLTFDLPQSPLVMMNPVLLLAFKSPLAQGDLDVAFVGPCLQPTTQMVCISGGTQYILLTGKSEKGRVNQKWQISAETKNPAMKQNLKDILIDGKSGSNISMTPLLLFSRERGTITRCVPGSPPASLQTSFLCELKRFLGAALPQKHLISPPLPLDSLQSLPPVTLGLSSSESLLAAIMNSTAPTVFPFTSSESIFPVCHGQLALSPALLEELRQRLEQTLVQMTDIMREENVAQGAKKSLGRLKDLSALQKDEQDTGGSQFRAFLLLKALKTVAQTYDVQRKLRVTRASPTSSERRRVCGLRALTVSLTKLLVAPPSANINSCHGSCAFPLANANNHAILLNSHIESGNVDERAPCCVPVAYEPLEVMDWNAEETFISIKPDVIARECGCR